MNIVSSRRAFVGGAIGAIGAASCQSHPPHTANRAVGEGEFPVLDNLLSQASELAMFNGVVKVERAGEVIFDKAYGLADYEHGRRFAADTRFCVASLSKKMTDAALGALIDRGRVSLDATLGRFIPQFPGADRITLGHITEHRSGIAHTNAQPWGDGSVRLSSDEVLRRLSELPLDFEPGAQRSYSNGGYAVLARVLEVVHGRPYGEMMRELVFDPLGMSNAGEVLDSTQPMEGLAKGYQPGQSVGARAPARYYAFETRQGGGSLVASAADVLSFFRAFYRRRLPGARLHPDLLGGVQARRGADGRAPGYYMDVHYVADADLIVSSTANNYAAEFRWAENIAQMVMGEAPLFTTMPATSSRRADVRWCGRYRYDNPNHSQNLEITVSDANTLLLTDRDTTDARALIPLQTGGYLDPLYYWCFEQQADGRLLGRPFYDGGYEVVLVPIDT